MIQKLVSPVVLFQFQDKLDSLLVNDDISFLAYENQWKEVLFSFGWSEIEYEKEIDRRWEYEERIIYQKLCLIN